MTGQEELALAALCRLAAVGYLLNDRRLGLDGFIEITPEERAAIDAVLVPYVAELAREVDGSHRLWVEDKRAAAVAGDTAAREQLSRLARRGNEAARAALAGLDSEFA